MSSQHGMRESNHYTNPAFARVSERRRASPLQLAKARVFYMLLLRFFVRRVLFALFAELFELYFALNFSFVFARPMLDAFANRALKLD